MQLDLNHCCCALVSKLFKGLHCKLEQEAPALLVCWSSVQLLGLQTMGYLCSPGISMIEAIFWCRRLPRCFTGSCVSISLKSSLPGQSLWKRGCRIEQKLKQRCGRCCTLANQPPSGVGWTGHKQRLWQSRS